MATRSSSRRSGGAESVATLNPTLLGLYSQARLKDECGKRNLPTDGKKDALIMRLEDFINGVVYISPTIPAVVVASTGSTPTTSRHASADTTPKSRSNSAKGPPPKRTPRRKNSAASAGEDETNAHSATPPPKKKPRRNSTKKEPPSTEIPKEEIIDEDISVTIVAAPAENQFDSDDDQPLIRPKDSPVKAAPATPAVEAKVNGDSIAEDDSRKNKRRRKDIESDALLAKGDSDWVPPEELEKRVTRDSAKRTRRNTDIKKEESEHESSPSASMPKLDPEIYDQDSHDDEEKKPKARTDAIRKPSGGEGEKKMKKDSIERPRTMSITSTPTTSGAAKRKESAVTPSAPPRPKEKPATQVYAELMLAQKKAKEAAAAAATASASNGVGTPTTTPAGTVAKRDSQEKEMSGGAASPLVTAKTDLSARRDSIAGGAATGSPAAATDGAAPKGFSMTARKNAPPRPIVTVPSADSSDLLGDLLGKQQVLLEKKVRSTAETEAEKIRIVHQMKQRDIREETVNKEKERLQREKKEKEEREKARLEKEKKEKELKMSVIAAPSRPIPPPPPPPPVPQKHHDNSPAQRDSPPAAGGEGGQEDAAAAVAAVEEQAEDEQMEEDVMNISAQYEPLEEYVASKAQPLAADHDEHEYDPLAMPALDRSIADAHHRQRREREAGKKSKDHDLKAPEIPELDEPFLLRLAEKMKLIERQRETNSPAPITDEIRECMEDLLKKVDAKVEKEMKWERRTKRKSEYQVEREKEEEKKRAQMMRDPRALLAKATNILENMGSIDEEGSNSPNSIAAAAAAAASAVHIVQDLAEPGTYDEEKEDRPLPEFHGEPVPSDDDEALFLEAAGLPRKDKKPKHPVVEEEAPPSHEHILMDYYNACLHIKSSTDKPWLIDPDNENGLALMWGGVRANHGYVLPWREEKKCLVFQIKMIEHQSIRHIPFNEQEPHDVRVGFSLRASPNIMGEAPLSWAFSTTGKKCVNNAFQEWGDPIEIGDVVTAVLDFSAKCISFWKNEACMGVAFRDVVLPEEDDAVYAHVCVKNCKVAVNLGDFPDVDGGWVFGRTTGGGGEQENAPPATAVTPAALVRDPEWAFPTEIERKKYEMSRLPPNEKAACTLLMMVGLPGVGKSTWVRQYIRDHPQEKWDVINAEAVMAAMKVNGVNRGRAHTGRWDMVLGLVAKALQKMVLLAARRRRNYIIDLSNVNKDSRKRRLMHFTEFTKKCIVIVPDEEEMVNRQMKQTRQEGASHVPAEAILEMKAVFTFPTEEAEGFDEVHLIEPAMPRIAEAIEIIQRFNEEGKPWFQKRYRGRGSRRGGRGGYMGGGGGGGDRRGSDFNRPLSVSTAASNGSGPPTNVGAGRPSPGAWGMGESPSGPGHFSWASRKSSN